MLWDEGTYTTGGGLTKNEIEKNISQGLVKGQLEFELFGEKLKGKFVLRKWKDKNADKLHWL